MQFSEKVVLVAGGTGGLGRAVSLAFLEGFAKVTVSYRRRQEFDALRASAGARASSLQGVEVDVTDDQAVRQCVQNLIGKFGRLDILINTVGGYAGGTPLWELDPEVFEQMLALNLRSQYLLCRAVVPVMLKQSSGVIINVASRAAVDHAAGAAAYAASKAAALAMTDSLAADLRGTGVRVTSILPSIIDTEVNRKAMPKADFTKWPKPDEIAKVILFLCSDDARLIQGAAVPVYGET